MQLPIFPLAGIFLPPISNRAGLKIDSQLKLLQKELGYRFKDPALLLRCLTHVSYDGKKSEGHNEVLEFLGDAVLDLAVSDLLMRRNPDKSEGDLSKMRAALVNSAVLAEKAMLLKLGPALQIGKGEERSGGRTKPSILAGAFEALLGGVYHEGGYEAARAVVERYFAADVTITRRDCKRLARGFSMPRPLIAWFPKAGRITKNSLPRRSLSVAGCWAKARAEVRNNPSRKQRRKPSTR